MTNIHKCVSRTSEGSWTRSGRERVLHLRGRLAMSELGDRLMMRRRISFIRDLGGTHGIHRALAFH